MARKPKSVSEIDRQIEELKAKRLEALEAQPAHIGSIAAKADLNTLDIPDAELLKKFKAIAARFRGQATPPSSATPRSTAQ